jgi:hypothetical protein
MSLRCGGDNVIEEDEYFVRSLLNLNDETIQYHTFANALPKIL